MHFEEIESIEHSGWKDTYDLIVPEYHNFILDNGIVTHNSGKSTFAMTIAHFCDPTFFFGNVLDRVAFTFEQFMKAVDEAKPGQAIVLDEAILLFMAQDASTYLQKILQKKMTLIRKKRLFIFLVIPSFFLLRIYLAVLRSRFLIHTYTPDGVRRGYFKFYSYDTKRKLFFAGKKFMDMSVTRYDFHSRFVDTDGFFFDKKAYEKKKDEAILKLTEEPEKKKYALSLRTKRIRSQRDFLLMQLYNQLKTEDDNINTLKDFRDYLEQNYEIKFTHEGLRKAMTRAKEDWKSDE
ncbi:MAG: hypothetical protein R6U52_01370 [Kosmotogaceae bacterium]